MGRIRTSFALLRASQSVLREHKSLVVLPLVSMVATVVTAALFIAPIVATATTREISERDLALWQWALIALSYFASAYVAIFFMTALVAAADLAMRGGAPTPGWALGQAGRRWRQLLPWALISTTIGVLLRAIQERFGFLGAIVAGLAGLAWAVVSLLVIPLMVIENLTATAALKRSKELAERTWGENVTGNFSLRIAGILIAGLPAIVLFAVGVPLARNGGLGLFLACLALAIVWAIAVSIYIAALSGVFQVALYAFATQGQVPPAFRAVPFEQAFRPRRRGRSR